MVLAAGMEWCLVLYSGISIVSRLMMMMAMIVTFLTWVLGWFVVL